MLVVDKPAGVAVHGGSGVSFGVIEQLRAARPQAKFLELVHRLDRETSGLLMVAKKRNALLALHAMLREGKGEKHYLALVEGDWVNDRQHIKLSLSKWTTQSGERRVKVDPDGQRAHTIVSLKQRFGGYSLVDAELRTGRTHQIRVHLASSGFPIVGDDKYGNDEVRAQFSRQGFGRMFLHAHRLTLAHPLTGETLTLTAELPRMPEVVETVGVCLMSMYTLVVFDWDGTLMDSTHSIVAAIQGACRDLELPVPSASDASWVIGLSLESALRRAVPS